MPVNAPALPGAVDWRALLQAKVDASSMGDVAKELDCSRATVSLLLADKYPASTDKMAARVLAAFGRVQCPYLSEEISNAQCIEFHRRDAPTSSPFAMRHWRACQTCPNRRSK